MRHPTTITVLIGCAAMVGCASSPRDLAGESTLELCRSFGVYKGSIMAAAAPAYRAEMERRGALSDDEWELVKSGRIKIGASLCALYASWGAPSRENRSTGSWGTRIQHVYNAGLRYVRPTYVYTLNGKVTSWQD